MTAGARPRQIYVARHNGRRRYVRIFQVSSRGYALVYECGQDGKTRTGKSRSGIRRSLPIKVTLAEGRMPQAYQLKADDWRRLEPPAHTEQMELL